MTIETRASEDLVGFLERLMGISSPTGLEREAGVFLAEYLRRAGFKVLEQLVSDGRFNVLATTDERPEVLFSTHFDVVNPSIPFRREAGRIFGRGACDAKGALAAMVSAAERLVADGRKNVGLLFVVGEERNSDGARKAAELRLGSNHVILGEPTGGSLAVAQKGTLVFRLEVEGIAGHSAYPEVGRSAVHQLSKLVGKWLAMDWGKDELFGRTTLNFGTIEGGQGPNVIAASAATEGIFRVATSLEELNLRVSQAIEQHCQFRILSSCEPLKLGRAAGFKETVVSFGSDAPYLGKLGTVYLIGPGSILHAHTPDEQVNIAELEEAEQYYYRLGAVLSAQRNGETPRC